MTSIQATQSPDFAGPLKPSTGLETHGLLLTIERRDGNRENQCQPVGAVAGHSMAALAIAGGSRPARSQPAAVAASGTPTTASARYRNGTSPR
jgi:hypothetical protein